LRPAHGGDFIHWIAAVVLLLRNDKGDEVAGKLNTIVIANAVKQSSNRNRALCALWDAKRDKVI